MTTAPVFLEACRARVDARLTHWLTHYPLPDDPGLNRLREALHYSVLQGGKRVRPALAYAAALACDADADTPGLDTAAAAVELIHAYSLVHDDLPAMDDDALRRGQPTCHKAFNEATAILAGDALQALAFEQLATETALPADIRLHLVQQLAFAAGPGGMVGGQMIDLFAVGRDTDRPTLERMHRLKTGVLIEAAILMGGLVARANTDQKAALRDFAEAIGLAFQVHDDVLDVAGQPGTLGKAPGGDAVRRKPTYPALLGLDAARDHARDLLTEACGALQSLGPAADTLAELAAFIVQRDH